MRKLLIVISVIMCAVLLAGCGITRAYRSGDTLLTAYDAFWAGGRQICLMLDKSSTRQYRTAAVDTEAGADISVLDSETVVFAEQDGRFYYTEKHRLMSSLPDGSDKRKECKLRTKVRYDRVRIVFEEDGLIVIRTSYGSIEGMGKNLVFRLSFPSESYSLYDIGSGSLSKLIAEGGSGIAPAFLAVEDGYIYYLQLDGETEEYGLYRLKTDGSGREFLGALGKDLSVEGASGCFKDGTLFICCGELWSWSGTEGLREQQPGLESGEPLRPIALKGFEDRLYVLYRGTGEAYDAYVYAWDPEKDMSVKASSEDFPNARGLSFKGGEPSVWTLTQTLDASSIDTDGPIPQ